MEITINLSPQDHVILGVKASGEVSTIPIPGEATSVTDQLALGQTIFDGGSASVNEFDMSTSVETAPRGAETAFDGGTAPNIITFTDGAINENR